MKRYSTKSSRALASLCVLAAACGGPSTTDAGPGFDGGALLDIPRFDGGRRFDSGGDGGEHDATLGGDSAVESDSGAFDSGPSLDGGPPAVDAGPPPVRISPSCDPAHATIMRLYHAFFGREPDAPGANHWIEQNQAGVTIAAIGASFGDSAEFRAAYDGLDDTAFVTAVYRNVLGREPDAPGLAHWLTELGAGLSRTGLVLLFAESPEFRARFPYSLSLFCEFVQAHAASYVRRQVAPGVVYARSADGNVNIAFVDTARGGTLRVPPAEMTSSCADRSIPSVRLRPTGHFGGTLAINANWFGCYLPAYIAGYSISAGEVRGATGDHREGFVGQDASGNVLFGHYQDIAFAVPSGAHHLVSGKTLVIAGALWPDTTTASGDPTFTNRNPRSAIGIRGDYLIFAVIDGRRFGPGMTGTETGNLLLALGSERAMMLDGGGSSALFVAGRGIVNEPSDGSPRSVASQLVFEASSVWVD